jgi:hypothetical protein
MFLSPLDGPGRSVPTRAGNATGAKMAQDPDAIPKTMTSTIVTPLETGFRSERRIKALLLMQGIQGEAVGTVAGAPVCLIAD